MFSFMLESAPPSFLCYTAYSHAHSATLPSAHRLCISPAALSIHVLCYRRPISGALIGTATCHACLWVDLPLVSGGSVSVGGLVFLVTSDGLLCDRLFPAFTFCCFLCPCHYVSLEVLNEMSKTSLLAKQAQINVDWHVLDL